MEPHEAFLEQTFSTPEAAAILDIPVETLRTQLKKGWLPIDEGRNPGGWRRFNPDALLRIRLAHELSERGIFVH